MKYFMRALRRNSTHYLRLNEAQLHLLLILCLMIFIKSEKNCKDTENL